MVGETDLRTGRTHIKNISPQHMNYEWQKTWKTFLENRKSSLKWCPTLTSSDSGEIFLTWLFILNVVNSWLENHDQYHSYNTQFKTECRNQEQMHTDVLPWLLRNDISILFPGPSTSCSGILCFCSSLSALFMYSTYLSYKKLTVDTRGSQCPE